MVGVVGFTPGQKFRFKDEDKIYTFDYYYFVDSIPHLVYSDGNTVFKKKGVSLSDLNKV